MIRRLLCLLTLASFPAFATELDEVRTALGTLLAKEPIGGSVAISRWERRSGEKKAEEGSAGVTFAISASKSGVSAACSEALASPPKPAKNAKGDPDAAKLPAEVQRNIVGAVDLHQVSHWLNHSRSLLEQLEGAEVLEEKDTNLDQKPAKVMKLKLKTEHVDEGGASFTSDRTVQLWTDPEHLPLAAEFVDESSGGLLMIKVKVHQKVERKYARIADRLVVVEETEENETNTMGRLMQSRQNAKLTLK
jgi:hypothetical protein